MNLVRVLVPIGSLLGYCDVPTACLVMQEPAVAQGRGDQGIYLRQMIACRGSNPEDRILFKDPAITLLASSCFFTSPTFYLSLVCFFGATASLFAEEPLIAFLNVPFGG
jgi:hypothetical protein